MQSCYQLVWLAAERTPNQLAMVDDRSDRQFTYRQLIDDIEAVAAGFADRGIDRGSMVATALPGCFDHAILLLALHRTQLEILIQLLHNLAYFLIVLHLLSL